MSSDGESVAAPSALHLARLVRGMTQAELADRAGLSQAYLSKAEKGDVELDGDRLRAVADALGYPIDFFTQVVAETPAPTACAFPRKRNSVPTSVEKRVRALLDITRRQVEPLLDADAPAVTLTRRAAEDEDWISPVEMAQTLREDAGVPSGPIVNLTALLEGLGVVVVVRDLGHRRIDALGQWPDGQRPLMLVNSTAPADRRRFTLAHELGHSVLHTGPRPAQEAEADQFAAEMLLPAADGLGLFDSQLDLARLAELKGEWGMSMAALARRAWDLGRISDYRYRQLNIELSSAGYRTREPVALAAEAPTLLGRCLARQLADGAQPTELATRAAMTEPEFSAFYLESPL